MDLLPVLDAPYPANSFHVTSGRMTVGDPAARPASRRLVQFWNVRCGEWVVQPEYVERASQLMVWMLRVVHVDHEEQESCPWLCAERTVEIRSGMCGFFDQTAFKNGHAHGPSEQSRPRRSISKTAQSAPDDPVRITDGYGVIAPAGYGKGSYECYYGKDEDGQIVEAEIVFFWDDEDPYGNPLE